VAERLACKGVGGLPEGINYMGKNTRGNHKREERVGEGNVAQHLDSDKGRHQRRKEPEEYLKKRTLLQIGKGRTINPLDTGN